MKLLPMILIDLFSGYGGFHLGLEQAGIQFTKTYFSEIDKHAIANYKYNFPNSEYLGTVENVPDIRADIVTFGSPCQDFSLAGKREGLKGGRSSLIEYAIRYIERERPPVFIWENVKGAFSANGGADFWAIIQAFASIGGYRLQWQLVNTVWWLPQNRERIYLVGLAGERSGCEIFPIGESNAVSNQTLDREQENESGIRIEDIATTLDARYGSLRNSGETYIQPKILQTNKAGQSFEKNEAGTLRSGASANYQVVAQRGRPQDGKNIQQLEPQESGTTNVLTGVQKDNLIVMGNIYESGGQNGNVYDVFGISPSISSGTTDNPNSGGVGSSNAPKIYEGNSIRRLTPTECERLQGLPDGWTKYGNYNGVIKEISDTQRYKLCGNGVSIPPVKAIGEKLNQ